MTATSPVYKLNLPPERYVSVRAERLQRFARDVGLALGLPDDQAGKLAELLTGNDLRGVHSHGTRMIASYADEIRGGRLNSAPEARVIRETPVSLIVDGDGGLGYFAAHLATERAIARSKFAPYGAVRVAKAALGNDAGMVGAAALVLERT